MTGFLCLGGGRRHASRWSACSVARSRWPCPLVFGALGGVLGERAGVVNIAIDGQLLAAPSRPRWSARSPDRSGAGWSARVVAGVLVALLLGLFAITYYVDQVIVGVVLNVLVIGITSFMFSAGARTQRRGPQRSPAASPRLAIPVLSDIPLIGPVLFRQSLLVYLLYVAVVARDLDALPHQVGPAGPRGRRAPEGRRHRRHQRQPHPLPHRAAGRRDRGHRRRRSTRWSPCRPSTGR